MTKDVAHLLKIPPFSLPQSAKEALFFPAALELTRYHSAHCEPYANILSALEFDPETIHSTQELPFFPSGLFKSMRLSSVPSEQEYARSLTSSGTTGSQTVHVELDRETAADQQCALAHIAADFIGGARLPMLILDQPSILAHGSGLSARAAGILGFSIFARRRVFALREDLTLDLPAIRAFLEQANGGPFLLFGFTFMVWKYFCQTLRDSTEHLDFSGGILIHGGGWKKLLDQAVPPEEFQRALNECCGLHRIYNYYGMAEQAGSVFFQCEAGRFHASELSEVFVRRAEDFSLCEPGEAGILQVLSLLPRSYPGHSLLTEDEGVFLGVDDCPCGRLGKNFLVSGRLQQAQLRGCSDVYAG